jgi:hypothetical protein
MSQKSKGKIVYTPTERCFTNVIIEETEHGYKIYKDSYSEKPMTFIPHSAVKQIEWRD